VTRWRCEFERVGRHHDVPPVVVEAETADQLAEKVYRAVNHRLLSSAVEVVVDLEKGTGNIFCGFQSGGTFTVLAEEQS